MSTGICHLCTRVGQCCEYIELPTRERSLVTGAGMVGSLARSLSDDEVHWAELHPGVTIAFRDYLRITPDVRYTQIGNMVHIESRCTALAGDGGCSLYGRSDERPRMCSDWPDQPETQAPDGCAYLVPEHRALMQAGRIETSVV